MLYAKEPRGRSLGVLIVCVLFVVLQGVKAFCAVPEPFTSQPRKVYPAFVGSETAVSVS